MISFIIGFYYFKLFFFLKKSMNKMKNFQQRNYQKTFTTFFIIIFTNFICWFPISILGLQCSIYLVFVWIVFLILGLLSVITYINFNDLAYILIIVVLTPLNSTLNPIVYTVGNSKMTFKRKNEKRKIKL